MSRESSTLPPVLRLHLRERAVGMLDLGLPADSLPRVTMVKLRTISAATLAMMWVAGLSIVQAVVVGKWSVVGYLAASCAAGVGNLFLLRRTRRPELSGHIAVAILAGLIAASAVVSGGFYDPSFAWLYILPLAAAVAVDLRGAAAWTLATVAITVAFWTLPELGIELRDQTPVHMQRVNSLVARVLSILALGAIGVGFVMGQRRTQNELERETIYLQLAMHAAVSANEARSFAEALQDAVERICTSMGWVAGHVLEVGEDGACRSTGAVHSSLPERSRLEALSRTRVFAPDDGLPGRAVACKEPQIMTRSEWRGDGPPGPGRDRAIAARELGLSAAIAIPVLAHGQVRAVLEFACRDAPPDPERILEVFTHIGAQLGRVAERTALQERMRQTQKMEAVGQLAAGVAHEINNPMAFVRSNLHSLLQMEDAGEKSDPDEFRELIEESLFGVERTIAIVRDITQFSRVGETSPDEWVPADVNELVRDSLRVASSDASPRIHFDVEAGELPPVRCSANGLRQVFLNLIVNAAQAVGEAGEIRIATRCEAEAIVVRIEDDGPGMTSRDRDRLFDPFFTTKPVGQGTGLGLTISYDIVKSHGGSIRVESEPDQGAAFEVRLPPGLAAR